MPQQENKQDMKLCNRSIEKLNWDMSANWIMGMNPLQYKKHEEELMQHIENTLHELEMESLNLMDLTQSESDLLTQNFLE